MRALARPARAGFTLIELLAVIVILSILAVALYALFGSQIEAVKVGTARAYLQQIAAACEAYESDESGGITRGDYPPSTFPAKLLPEGGGTNRGIESLVIALWSGSGGGYGLDQEHFVNSDGDSARRNLAEGLKSRELFELRDEWDNPIAYFHSADYGRKDVYVTLDENGEEHQTAVEALTSPVTKDYYRPRKFQLISAGEDGVFNTEDDLYNFKVD